MCNCQPTLNQQKALIKKYGATYSKMAKRFDRKHIEIADDLIKYKKNISPI